MGNSKKNINIEKFASQHKNLIELYLDVLYWDIVDKGIYPIKELSINKSGVPYPIAKALLKYLEKQERYEKCQIINEIIKNYKKSQNKKKYGKSIINRI